MKKITLATIGLAMFATPLAAGTPNSSGVSQHERHLNGLNPHASAVQASAGLTSRFSVAPAGNPTFGLTVPRNGAGPQFSPGGPWSNQDLRDRYGRIDR